MRITAAFLAAALPVAVLAQSEQPEAPGRSRIEITGCVKGSTLTETSPEGSSTARAEDPSRRWRIRGSKALMRQVKDQADKELRVVGTTKDPRSGYVVGGKRVGKSNIYIGGKPDNTSMRDPLPEQPTIDVESVTATGATCR